MIKAIGTAARRELERELGCQVYLELSVRVRRDWRADEGLLDRLGITERPPESVRPSTVPVHSLRDRCCGDPSHGRQVEFGGEHERDAQHLQVATAKPRDLVVLEACSIVDRARGHRGGAHDVRRGAASRLAQSPSRRRRRRLRGSFVRRRRCGSRSMQSRDSAKLRCAEALWQDRVDDDRV